MTDTIKIASYNIQSCFGDVDRKVGTDSKYCAAVIKEYDPVFVGLNEVSSGGDGDPYWGGTIYELQPQSVAKAAGEYPYSGYLPIIAFGQRFYGNAIISKYPLKNLELIPIEDPIEKNDEEYFETRGILKAEIDVLGGITLYVSHFGLARDEKINAVKKVLEVIGDNPTKTILMGDFNMEPSDEKLAPIYKILKDTAEGYNEKDLWSWPADVAERKIDYIFVSKDIKVLNTSVSDKIGSDHKMILAEISL